MKYLLLLLVNVILAQNEEDPPELDLDAMWENTVWEEIQEVTEVYGEVEQITAVAGVRGAEAEDEALNHLYYRKTMKGLAVIELRNELEKSILTD